MKNNNYEITTMLTQRRRDLKLTTAQLSACTGISQQMISHYENNGQEISFVAAVKLAKALRLPLDVLATNIKNDPADCRQCLYQHSCLRYRCDQPIKEDGCPEFVKE